MSRLLAAVLAGVILLASGVLRYSLATDSEQLEEAVARLPHVPLQIGDWKAQEVAKEDLDEPSFRQSGAKGYWVRTYVHQPTGAGVLVILMCGRPGKMAVHTPDICYRGAGYEMLDQPAVCSIKNDQGAEGLRLWTALFSKKTGVGKNLRLYWAWNSRGVWEASPNPRWQFRGAPFLYKLYVSRDRSLQPQAAADVDPAADLLRELAPELNRALFPPGGQASSLAQQSLRAGRASKDAPP